ncbi:MAG TPA: hypothetical protein VEI96_01560 [Thermodesulfovibrionales bacterium]|nr:hypothetical protein [Thermodesulfovibrionales bacterium]
MEKCPACTTSRNHTDKFDRIYDAIFNEVKKRGFPCIEDPEELSKTLSVLVADSLDIDIYE